ncbi:MAG: hypothetical protein WCO06_05805, partial [Candidatus Roizmanbacteria bacterium]
FIYMLFNKPIAILYIHPSYFSLIKEGSSVIEHIKVPETVVNHMTIISRAIYDDWLGNFILQNIVKKYKLIIVLSEELVFHKELSEDKEDNKLFIERIPFQPEQLIHKNFIIQNKAYIYVIIKDFIEQAQVSVQKSGSSITAIIPEQLLNIHFEAQSDAHAVIQTIKKFQHIEELSM